MALEEEAALVGRGDARRVEPWLEPQPLLVGVSQHQKLDAFAELGLKRLVGVHLGVRDRAEL